MLASHLVRSFVFSRSGSVSSEYLALYCQAYGGDLRTLPDAGRPPSRGHAETMAKTLQEWANSLDASGIQVHQEGAIARFQAAAEQGLFGRVPPAVEARKKTCGFYADVLCAAVRLRGARSFLIPATSAQAAEIAAHEALAAAGRFASAQRAVTELSDPSRPELVQAREQAQQGLGRAVAMHQTAVAEAVACAAGATPPNVVVLPRRGRDQSEREYLARVREALRPGLVCGVELPASDPALEYCQMSLDPQHGGGIYGFGLSVPDGLSAVEAAAHLVRFGWEPMRSLQCVVTRLDPDAACAVSVLTGRVPVASLSVTEIAARIADLGRYDSAVGQRGTWHPRPLPTMADPFGGRPVMVGEAPEWGALNALLLGSSSGGVAMPGVSPRSLEECLDIAAATLLHGPDAIPEDIREAHRANAAALVPYMSGIQISERRGIAYHPDLPLPGGTRGTYCLSPVSVLSTASFRFGPTTGRKHTVSVDRDADQRLFGLVPEILARLQTREPGWGGNVQSGILGSPFGAPSQLSVQDVVGEIESVLSLAGIEDVRRSVASQLFTHLR